MNLKDAKLVRLIPILGEYTDAIRVTNGQGDSDDTDKMSNNNPQVPFFNAIKDSVRFTNPTKI